ncbi:BatD family protein [Dyella soli]|uniref:DUF7939 domain-containing protein n=1 Tax=Dyella soli TaxID=522319 RepID=A0A4R0YFQ1_9GAMM|nr:BatD family protein [Dyella soli]TCI06983.1 hypothetical protein EZM97_30670 [Dyella soli]
MKAWLACLLLSVAGLVLADEPSPLLQVRVHQEPAGTLLQGETTRIQVDALTPSFFTDAPAMPALHVDGVYLALSDETPGHLVETIDGVTWSGVSRTYLITPLVSGAVEFPAFEVTAHIGAASTPVTARTLPLTLQVQALPLPAGVTEAVVAGSLTVTQVVTPDGGGLHVGDSVTRRIEVTAQGAPAMMLPPVSFDAVDGLALYASPPTTRDVFGSHGGFVGGSRVDAATYVIRQRGRYTLPPLSVRWMDSRSRLWRTTRVPAVHFYAWWGAPATPRFALPGQGIMPRVLTFLGSDLGLGLVMLAALGAAAWLGRRRLQKIHAQYQAWRYRRRHAERIAFAAVRRQRHATSAAMLHAAVDAWVRRCADDGGPATPDEWCRRFGDASLRDQWNALQAALYGESPVSWAAAQMVDGLSSARRRWKQSERRARLATSLPPLNPA